MNLPVSNTQFDHLPIDKDMDCDLAIYKTLLESTKAIPWKIDWKTMTFAYIGPQIEELLGWPQESWVSAEDWAARIHEDERDAVVEMCVNQSMAGIDHEADYRALTADGQFVWIRDVVHVARNAEGEVESLIGFMFDITDRKRTEQELVAAQKRLETLSFEDGLTGAANRRLFDRSLEKEWDNAKRQQQPLSLILLDLDHFKQFNDHYGHLEGDDCLIRVARALKEIGARPRDVVARYGGEEFILLLPETDAAAAQRMAQRCQEAIAALDIAHANSPSCHRVTASIGLDTVVPAAEGEARDLIETVDRLLYSSKEAGRNRITTRAA